MRDCHSTIVLVKVVLNYDDMTVRPLISNIISVSVHSRSKWSRKRFHRAWWDALVVLVCVLSVLPVPAMSAPLAASSPKERHPRSSAGTPADLGPTGDAKWIKPCGIGGSDPEDASLGAEFDSDMVFDDNEELSNIVLLAKTAQAQAAGFKHNYVKNTFNVDFEQHHESWKTLRYVWLPTEAEIPKNLGESTPLDHLQSLQLDEALRNSYEYLQKFAVALEQVVWDQEEGSSFKSDFQVTEFRLRSVLCEIQAAMLERNVKQKADITRDIMTSEYREMSKANSSVRNLRDWFIFRDYMNGLEYVADVFQYFIDKPSS